MELVLSSETCSETLFTAFILVKSAGVMMLEKWLVNFLPHWTDVPLFPMPFTGPSKLNMFYIPFEVPFTNHTTYMSTSDSHTESRQIKQFSECEVCFDVFKMCFKWVSSDRAKSASYLFICWWRWKVNINFINILLKARDSFPCSWTENKYKTIMYIGAVAFQRLSDSFTPYYCSTWKANHNTGRK